MERYCGYLKHGLQSKRHPWANLTKRILHASYLSQLSVRYDLDIELESAEYRDPKTCSQFERQYDNCE